MMFCAIIGSTHNLIVSRFQVLDTLGNTHIRNVLGHRRIAILFFALQAILSNTLEFFLLLASECEIAKLNQGGNLGTPDAQEGNN